MTNENIKQSTENIISENQSTEFIGVKDVAGMLGISEATVRNWIKLGKITVVNPTENVPSFEYDKIVELKKSIESGKVSALKSRRNKKYVTGSSMYRSYVASHSPNLLSVSKLLSVTDKEIDDTIMEQLLLDCAEKLMIRALLPNNVMDSLLDSLQKACELVKEKAGEPEQGYFKPIEKIILRNVEYEYISNEDTLGFLYISLLSLNTRKSSGAYYTDADTVSKVTSEALKYATDTSVYLDPCCGTGNFLLQLPDNASLDRVYGFDIDVIAAAICKINMAMKFHISTDEELQLVHEHFSSSDFLLEYNDIQADIIIGNPPWGYDFNKEQQTLLSKAYYCAAKKADSADIFIECALSHLNVDGCLAFVLPESVLSVKGHLPIRKYIKDNAKLKMINYLGDIFYKVQCPCIILSLLKTKKAPDFLSLSSDVLSATDLEIITPTRTFNVEKRDLPVENLDVLATDEEYAILAKMEEGNKVYLKDNADFGLGIVTGNNKELISKVQKDGYEIILKGSDIMKYNIDKPDDRYIKFDPERFQQVAPEYIYRSEERLLYRFIAESPVVAYDNEKTLSMNSCNIIIPHIENMPVRYIEAVLNSNVISFYYKHKFKSVKVLRSFLEQLPIPVIAQDEMNKIAEMAETLQAMGASVTELYTMQISQIDALVARAFGITNEELEVIKNA